MVSAYTYPTFKLSDTVPLLAITAAREQKLEPCPEIPYCPLPYLISPAHLESDINTLRYQIQVPTLIEIKFKAVSRLCSTHKLLIKVVLCIRIVLLYHL